LVPPKRRRPVAATLARLGLTPPLLSRLAQHHRYPLATLSLPDKQLAFSFGVHSLLHHVALFGRRMCPQVRAHKGLPPPE
jgi:hypothetical protein